MTAEASEGLPAWAPKVFIGISVAVVVALGLFILGGDPAGSPMRQAEPGASPTTGPEGAGVDEFDRSGPGLGEGGPIYRWIALSGTWDVIEEEAAATFHEGFATYAVTDVGAKDGTAEVTVAQMADGAGVVIRFIDPDNHWALRAIPSFGGWQLVKVTNGEVTTVADVAGSTTSGVRVGLRNTANTVSVVVDGEVLASVEDATHTGVTQVGLTMKGPQTSLARFDDFAFTGG